VDAVKNCIGRSAIVSTQADREKPIKKYPLIPSRLSSRDVPFPGGDEYHVDLLLLL
jgi:hypothetical protein